MTVPAEVIGQPERLIQLERFVSQRNADRWCKSLSPLYPGADYWLCHEARVLQGFQRDPRFAARFVAVDLDRRVLVSEAAGHPLTHWLATPVGELEHPFQHSSDLVRLILGCLRALTHLSRNGLVHAGLRPDLMVLRQADNGTIDFDSLTFIDFSVAKSASHRIEKPLFIDLASPDAAYLAPSMREAVERDWQTYAKVCGEPGKSSWYELSDSAKRQYESVMMPDLAVNALDWRVDLFALGHWFRQISLHRIDYYRDTHQEALPALIKRMQKPVLQGGFTSLEACIKAFEALEVDHAPSSVPAPPLGNGLVTTMQPTPVMLAPQLAPSEDVPEALPAAEADHTFAPVQPPAMAAEPVVAAEPGGLSKGRLVGMGAGLLLVAGVAALFMGNNESKAPVLDIQSPAPVSTETGKVSPPVPVVLATSPKGADAVSAPTEAGKDASPAPAASDAVAVVDKAALERLPLAELSAFAEKGDAAAQTQLGLRYRKGLGVAANNEKAVAWYQRAAEQNYPDAQAYLGFMYMTGRGVKKDDAEAIKWSRASAEQGNSTGQFNLATLLMAGRGGAVDRVEAYRWLKKAADKDAAAKTKLVELRKLMTSAELSKADSL